MLAGKSPLAPLFQRGEFVLWLIALLLLFISLGGRELWTQESRWSNIVLEMVQSGDFWHPTILGEAYYDKPLLSYWLMIAFSYITDGINLWSLRLPSVVSGLISIFCVVKLGERWFSKQTGLLAGLLLTTTFYFVFWSRVASSDMLNVAGVMLAITWYVYHDSHQTPSFLRQYWQYSIFFIIIALTSLCKGLIGAVLPILFILPHLWLTRRWKKHINLAFIFALLPAIIIYLIPFMISASDTQYQNDGLYLVFRENVERFFNPFDHKGPWYLYFLYVPIYTLPWGLLLPFVIYTLYQRWASLSLEIKWLIYASLLWFIFFSLSGSRRSYYVLPLVPPTILLCAYVIEQYRPMLKQWINRGIGGFAVVWLLMFGLAMPLYYSEGLFALRTQVHEKITANAPSQDWQFVYLGEPLKVPLTLQNGRLPLFIHDPNQLHLDALSKHHVLVLESKTRSVWPALVGYEEISEPPVRGKVFFGKKYKPEVMVFIKKDA